MKILLIEKLKVKNKIAKLRARKQANPIKKQQRLRLNIQQKIPTTSPLKNKYLKLINNYIAKITASNRTKSKNYTQWFINCFVLAAGIIVGLRVILSIGSDVGIKILFGIEVCLRNNSSYYYNLYAH